MTAEQPWESDARHQRNTFLVLMGHAATLCGWEIYTIVSPWFGDTLSATIRALGENQALIPFAMSMFMGHLWGGAGPRVLWAVLLGFICGVVFWKLTDAARKKESDERAS